MKSSAEITAIINAMDEKTLVNRRQLASMLDCSQGNIIEAQRAKKLTGTLTQNKGVSTFLFSKADLQNWRANSGTQSTYAKFIITADTPEQVEVIKSVLSKAKLAFALTLKK